MTITTAAEQQPQTGAAAGVAPPPPAPADSAAATSTSKRSRREPAHRPVVAMPVGPVLVGATNVATIAGATLYAAAGPAGLVAAAATVAGLGAARATHRGVSNKRATGSVFGARRTGRSTTGSPGGRRAGGPGGGRAAAGNSRGGLLGGHRTGAAPTGRGRATGGAGTGKGPLGGRGAAGKGPTGGGRSGAGNGRGGLLGGRDRTGGGSGTSGTGMRPSRAGRLRRATSRLARAARPLGRIARPLGRGAVRLAKATGPLGRGIGRALVSPVHAVRAARQGLRAGASPWAAARAARTRALKAGARRGRRHARWLRGWGAGLLALSAGGARSAWRAARRRYSGEQPVVEPEAPGRVAPEVRQSSGEEATPSNPTAEPVAVPAPVPAPVLVIGGHRPASTQGDDPMSSRRLLALAQEMVEVARRHEPEGMLEVVADYHLMPEILANVALALKTAHEKAQERYPVHTTVCDTIASVHRAQLATTSTARDVGPAIERLHKVDLDRLRAPRKGAVAEAMWDVRANRERM